MRFFRGMYREGTRNASFLAVIFAFSILLGTTAVRAADTIQLRWEFEEAAGSGVVDSSGPNAATLYNNPARVAGYAGSGISLNGINQYVQSNARVASLGISDRPYALSAWVQVPAGVQNGNIIHISSATNGSGWCIPFLRLQNGVFQATGWDSNAVSAVGTTPVQPGQWYQVLTTWDPTNGLRLFVNGTLEDSSPQSTFDAYGSPVYVSAGLGNSMCSENQGYFRGVIDDVRVYDRVIEPEDVVSINNPVPASSATDGSSGEVAGAGLSTGGTLAPLSNDVPLSPNTGVYRASPIAWREFGIVTVVAMAAVLIAVVQLKARRQRNIE